MKVNILNAADLFDKQVHYVIPEFQRRYVWCEDEQWDPFWEDVKNTAEEYLDNLTKLNDENKAQTQTTPHFLGAIIIQQQPTTSKEPEKRIVIDGQQRLTTLQLFLDAIQWVCEDKSHPEFEDHAKTLADFVTNSRDRYKGEYIFKLWPSKFDQDEFRHVMDNNLSVGDKGGRIAQAHVFFQERVSEWLKNAPENQLEFRISALVETVTTRLQTAVIDLDEQMDPYIIFETLNARGTPLAQFELIKNFVMSKTEESINDIWGELNDEWWAEEIPQRGLYRPRLDIILNYWLEAHSALEVKPKNVFKAFVKYVDGQDIVHVMSKIRRDFTIYREYKESKGRSLAEKSFYHHMDIMKTDVIMPVLLLLLANDNENVNARALAVLESFLIRRMICRHTARGYSQLVLKLVQRLQANNEKISDADVIITKFLKEGEARATKWPADDTIKEELIDAPLYDMLSQGRVRLILEGVEEQLRASGKIDDHKLPEKLTIEHVMPIWWNENNWPLSEGISEEERDMLVNTIGNLTLVTQPLNSSMSNSSWETKRKALQEYSLLMLNKKFSTQMTWNEKEIKSRSLQLAEIISDRWPGPDSQKWDC